MAKNISDLTKQEASAIATKKALAASGLKEKRSAPATEDEIELVREYLEALREEARIKTLKDTIKGIIGEDMLQKHVTSLTYDDMPIVTVSPTTQTTRNWAGLEADHPEIAAQYTTSVPTTRMDFKKNILPPK